jgi:hypothetical protein
MGELAGAGSALRFVFEGAREHVSHAQPEIGPEPIESVADAAPLHLGQGKGRSRRERAPACEHLPGDHP